MADFDGFMDSIKTGLEELLGDSLGIGAASAKDRAAAFVRESESDLRRWTRQLADGELSSRDFEALVQGKADLGRLQALLEAGAAKVEAEKLRAGLVDLVKDSAAEFIRDSVRS